MLSLLMFALSCPACIVFACFSLHKIHPTWDLVSRFLYNQNLTCFSLYSHSLSSELTHLFLLLIEMRPSLLKATSALWGRLCRLTRTIQRESTIVVTTYLRSQVSFSTSLLTIPISESMALPTALIKKTVFWKGSLFWGWESTAWWCWGGMWLQIQAKLPRPLDLIPVDQHNCSKHLLLKRSSAPNVTKRSWAAFHCGYIAQAWNPHHSWCQKSLWEGAVLLRWVSKHLEGQPVLSH